MKKLTRRIAVAVSSVAVAGVAVVGAGGTASAATPASVRVQRSAAGVNAADYRWDHGVGYLIEQDMEGFDLGQIVGVTETALTPTSGSPLR
ncbi:hypothetical protein [Streptomyces sp. NPDC048665]|uniref:hypothetical protein n=1 Tax=Streptomyces sp. NPDC048665 TaxID=3155490 RepID=UPI003413691E